MSTLEGDSFLKGFLIAVILPVVGYAFFILLNEGIMMLDIGTRSGLIFSFSRRLLALLGICLVLIPFNYFNKRRMINTMRGMILPTLMYVIFWMYRFKVINIFF